MYTDFVSTLVPSWLGMQTFWTYFGGVALICAGILIVFKTWIKPVALLLALMLFLWLIVVHIPNAVADPYVNNGNRVVSAFDALLFCGIALVIASLYDSKTSMAGSKVAILNL